MFFIIITITLLGIFTDVTVTMESDDWMTGTDDALNRTECELGTKLTQDIQMKGTQVLTAKFTLVICSLYFCLLYFVNGLINKKVSFCTVLGNINLFPSFSFFYTSYIPRSTLDHNIFHTLFSITIASTTKCSSKVSVT